MTYVKNPDSPFTFFETLQLLEQLVDNKILFLDPDNQNNIIVYKTNLDKKIFGVSEGWCSENIHSVAQTLQYDKESLHLLVDALEEKGVTLTFRSL